MKRISYSFRGNYKRAVGGQQPQNCGFFLRTSAEKEQALIKSDLLVREIPIVLHREIYAVAGLAAALVVVFGQYWRLPPTVVAVVAAILCFGLRLISIHRNWHLPIAGPAN